MRFLSIQLERRVKIHLDNATQTYYNNCIEYIKHLYFGGIMAVAGLSVSVLLIIAIIIGAGVAVITVITAKRKKKIDSLPQTAGATVVSKRYDYRSGNIVYCADFSVENMGKVELSMTAAQFESLNEGDVGIVTYQNNKLIGFAK